MNIFNNKRILVFFCIVLIVILLILPIVFNDNNKDDTDTGDTYDQNIRIINEMHPVKVVIYGEDIIFRDELKYVITDQISRDIMRDDEKKYERVVLIVNDLKGTTPLLDTDLDTIKYLLDNERFDFYYLGTNNIESIISNGIWAGEITDEDLSVGTALYYNSTCYFRGIWTEYDEKMSHEKEENLGMILIMQIVSCLKSNN